MKDDEKKKLHNRRVALEMAISEAFHEQCVDGTIEAAPDGAFTFSVERMADAVAEAFFEPGERPVDYSVHYSGVDLIARERKRQIVEEGWSAQHDDSHADGSLAMVAAIYALPEWQFGASFPGGRLRVNLAEALWPTSWSRLWYKPCPDDRIRELVKAGALIAAEIDRLQRRKNRMGGDDG